MADTFQVITRDFVKVMITNSKLENACCVEKRFQKRITISDLKGKLELVTGGLASTMKLELYNKEDTLLCTFDDDSALLGSYPIDDGMRIHVIDKFTLQDMDDLSKVEKFKLSEEEYAKRTDTVKAFLERNRLGKYNAEEMKKREEERRKEEAADEAAAKAITVGDRCQVSVPGQAIRRAAVMFVGQVEFKQGWWIGVKYDEPLGKNNGTVNGKKYFECQPKYGGFVKPSYLTVGDFPEETFDLDEEI